MTDPRQSPLPPAWRCSNCGDTEPGADMPMRDCTGPLDAEGNCGYWEPVTEPKLSPCNLHVNTGADPTCSKCRQSDLSPCSHENWYGAARCSDCGKYMGPEDRSGVIESRCESPLQTCDCQAHGGKTHPESPDESNNAPDLMARIDELEAERDALRTENTDLRNTVAAYEGRTQS